MPHILLMRTVFSWADWRTCCALYVWKRGEKKLLSAEQWNMLSSVMRSGEHLRHYWDTWRKGKQIRKTLITNYIFIFIIVWRDTMIKSITYHKKMMILSWWGCTVSGNDLNFENPSNVWSDDESVLVKQNSSSRHVRLDVFSLPPVPTWAASH